MSFLSSWFSFLSRSNQIALRGRRRSFRVEPLESRLMLAADFVDDLAILSDEFDDGSTISAWERVNEAENWNADQLQVWNINDTQPGRMVMVPHSVTWYQNWRGPMAFKQVTGDFVATTEVYISDRDDVGNSDADDVPNDAQFSLGGLMIRTPRDIQNPDTDWSPGTMTDDGTNTGENYIFLSMGYGAGGGFTFEVKTTRNSNSQLELTPVASNTAKLRTARIGDAVITLYQLPGEDWVVHRRYHRPDLPETLQVGIVTYSDWEKANDFDPFYHNGHVLEPGGSDPTPDQPYNPDLVAGFEYARYARPQVPAELDGVNLFTATDQQLLSFLGDADSQPADPTPEPAPNADLAVGMNLVNIRDWSRAWIFKDAFKMSRPWSSRMWNTETWQQNYGGQLELDDRGWVTRLEQSINEDGQLVRQTAETYLFSEGGNPAGQYRAFWHGEGELFFNAAISEQGTLANGQNYAVIELADDQPLIVTIRDTTPENYIRDIQLFMPDYEGESLVTDQENDDSAFHPLFVERLEPFDTIRFMQWQDTNGIDADVLTWEDHRPGDYATQASDQDQVGVSVEYIVGLTNELGSNAWVNMPHAADDDYVRNFAEYVRDNIHGDAHIYVEWSNEVWNSAYGFNSNQWVWDQLVLPANSGLDFFDIWAREARRDFAIWEDVFAGQEERIIRVAAGQQSNPWLTGQLLERMDGQFDVVSATSYAGIGGDQIAQFDENTTAEDVVEVILNETIPWSISTQNDHMQLAEQYSAQLGREIEFVTYEGGSHPDGFGTPYQDVVHQASLHPRMSEVYSALLQGMEQIGVGMHTQYVFTGRGVPSPWGEFGMLHEQDMSIEDAHDYRTLLEFIARDSETPQGNELIGDQTIPHNQDILTIALPATGADGTPLSYSASVVTDLLSEMDDQHGLFSTGNYWENWSGRQEKWIQGNSGWYYLLPNGEFWQWNGGFENSLLLATVAPSAYHDPALLHDPQPPATAAISDNVLVIDPIVGFVGEFDVELTTSSGSTTSTQRFTVSVRNNAPTLEPIESQTMPHTQDTLSVQVFAADADNDELSLSASVVHPPNYLLDQQYGFSTDGNFYENWGGLQERWIIGAGGSWFYLLPDGSLYEWSGNFDSSQLIATLGDDAYDDPTRLTDAQPISVFVDVVGSNVIVDPNSDSPAEFEVEVVASDGLATTRQTFSVTVQNEAPVLSPIADQTMSADQTVLNIAFTATDADGDDLSITVEVIDEAYTLDQSLGLTTTGNFYEDWGGQQEKWLQGSDGGWFYILANGDFYRWQGSFESSVLIENLETRYYEDPFLLVNAQPLGVTANIVGNELIIERDEQFTGQVQVRVTASDGIVSTMRLFSVTIQG